MGNVMKTFLFIFIFMFAASAYAEHVLPAVDFFMHGRSHDTFLRDYFRFEEPKPFRIEYHYVNWLDSGAGTDEYRDHLHLECTFSAYMGEKLLVDLPFRYSRVPIWAESKEANLGRNIGSLHSGLIARWPITDRLKSIVGFEYNTKGDGKNFGKSAGRMICLLKGFLSYDLHEQLNFAVGGRFDRYYYDTDEFNISKLSDRLYLNPSIMVNWHLNNNLILLLGVPDFGISLGFGNTFKAEARGSINKEAQLAFRTKPIERTNITLRFFNTPYVEVPVRNPDLQEGDLLGKRLTHTDRNVCFEIGWELNPAALASLGIQYGLGGDVKLKELHSKKACTLDGKPYLAIGVIFTVDIETLFQLRF